MEAFWGLSLMEIQDLLEAHARRREEGLKTSVWMQFLQAELVLRFLTREKDDPVPMPWDYYPELFKEEGRAYEEATEVKRLEDFKARRRQYADALNRRRRGV